MLTRRQLIARGYTVTQLAAAVHRGQLVRVRRGHYARLGVDPDVEQAVRVGGLLTCVSELRRRGIWVVDDGVVHVQLPPNASRLRDPDDRTKRLTRPADCVTHWLALLDPAHADRARVSVVDALATAVRCLPPRLALAALDSALNQRKVTRRQLDLIAASLPADKGALLDRVDAAAESGLETIVRMVVVDLGFRVRSQPFFEGVGREDLEIEGGVIVETDGATHHGAEVTTRDRRRDAALVARNKTVLHFRYAQVMFELRAVAEAIIAAVESHRGIRNSGQLARRARHRLESLDLS